MIAKIFNSHIDLIILIMCAFYLDLKIVDFITYHQVSNIRCTLVGNQIVDHSDVVGASPIGAAPTNLHSTPLNTGPKYIVQRQLQAATRHI